MADLTGKKPSEFSEETKQALLNAILPYKSFVGLITHYPNAAGSNPLTIGREYLIKKYYEGDDFTNVGGANESETRFIATGTMANDYSHNSELYYNFHPSIIVLHNQLGDYSIERFFGSETGSEFRLYLDELQVFTDFQRVYMIINILPDAAPSPLAFDSFAGIEQGVDENGRAYIRINCIDWLLVKTPIEIRMYN